MARNDRYTVTSLANAGIAPKDIRTYLRQNSDTIATQQDIYNRIAESKRELCEGQSTIQALANQLDNEGFWCRMQLDSDGRVTAVLFAHPDLLAYLQAYPDLLFLDCTYKTNRYGMPLLDMIGVDACERSFCIAFAFLSGETEEDYIWALDRLRSVHWHAIVGSADEETFGQRVQEMEKRYVPQYLEEVGYIKANWLDLHKEKLVKAWVDQHPHFGNVVTSRVEGIHALLKSHLKKSTLDLFEAWRAMKQALLNQLAELQYNQAKQQIRIPIELSGLLYSAAIYQRYVSAREDWYKAQPRGSLKTNQQYRKAMGLPQRYCCETSFGGVTSIGVSRMRTNGSARYRYKKSSYEWCLDYKYMGQRCKASTGARDWTKEEMMAYLDWTEAEDNRVEAQVAAEMESNRCLAYVRTLVPTFDFLGFVLFASASIMLLLALQFGSGDYGWKSSQVIGLFCGAGVTAAVFVYWERRMGDDAMIPLPMVRQKVVWSSELNFALLMLAVIVGSNFLPIYLQSVKGLSPTTSGVYMLASILPQIIFILAAGGLVKKFGYYIGWAFFSSVVTAIGCGLIP
ncbi:hypothetical protein O9K51_10476 [Purpureocillium lavendulum]|uniref:MULE transposase domain-containing protein n=1 Tax=Purpureocillium lavendulum TaxID=1247861 RepID=A0AB34FDI7_9HYPO|nr:hypothetical protein O9K51_10476 [Purpureocillium lavendulum]